MACATSTAWILIAVLDPATVLAQQPASKAPSPLAQLTIRPDHVPGRFVRDWKVSDFEIVDQGQTISAESLDSVLLPLDIAMIPMIRGYSSLTELKQLDRSMRDAFSQLNDEDRFVAISAESCRANQPLATIRQEPGLIAHPALYGDRPSLVPDPLACAIRLLTQDGPSRRLKAILILLDGRFPAPAESSDEIRAMLANDIAVFVCAILHLPEPPSSSIPPYPRVA